MVKNSRFADKKLCKLMKCGNREFFVIPVNFVITENKRKSIDFLFFQFFSCKLSDKLKLVLGQNIVDFFFRNYSPLRIFSACAL